MTVEVLPVGYVCQLACKYCYQEPLRDAGNLATSNINVEAMIEALEKEGQDFSIFGGEPLLTPIPVLEKLWKYGFERYGRNGIQTNGELITDEHIELFKKYNVSVGISIDGPGELNNARIPRRGGSVAQSTARTEANLEKLLKMGLRVGIIVTLHRGNALAEHRPRMKEWFRKLDKLGLRSARLHILEVENPIVRAAWALTDEENIEAFLDFAEFESELENLRFDKFRDIAKLLIGKDRGNGDRDQGVTCVWNACDPWTTSAVRGVLADGTRTNCGRTNKEGIPWVKSPQPSYERYISLYFTPQEEGGCQGCKYFLFCKGQCPGTAIDGDWRKKSEHCKVHYALFEHIEKGLHKYGVQTVTERPDLHELESIMIEGWASGRNMSVQEVLEVAARREKERRERRNG